VSADELEKENSKTGPGRAKSIDGPNDACGHGHAMPSGIHIGLFFSRP
jgi:hypothetical protein